MREDGCANPGRRLFLVNALAAGGAGFLSSRSTYADERLAGIACRSVHLAYDMPESIAFTNEVTVEKSALGTYFCACGFNMGYYGIQELGNGNKLLIFSVWDPGRQDDPNAVDASQRVKLTYQGEGVRVGRFGNEGTGGQSFFDYDWKLGETYRFLVTARPDGERTEYSGYFFLPETKAWKRLVGFSTLAKGKLLSGGYSFIEDFRRNRVSATQERRALFGPTWARAKSGELVPLSKARFTADANPAMNIDAGPSDNGRLFLATGGKIVNANTSLRAKMEHQVNTPAPDDLPEVKP